MAIYTHNATAVPGGIPWIDLDIGNNGMPLSTSGTLIVLQNFNGNPPVAEGTETRIIGTDFTFDMSGNPTGGTVTEVQRTSPGGGTVYETITSISLSVVDLFAAPDGFNFIFAGADTLNGFSGDDLLYGGAGADIHNGGSGGFDYASYLLATAGVTADLGTIANNLGDAAGDSYTSIEGLDGSEFADNLRGNGAANLLEGNGGNDFLRGRGGADTLNGGAGSDWADYIGAVVAVTVNLGTNTGTGGDAAGDSFNSIENIRGGDAADTLTGDANNNLLDGGIGNDSLNGGAGFDTARYTNTTITAGITALLSSTSTVTGNATVGTDTLVDVEQVFGTSFADSFTVTSLFSTSSGNFARFEGSGGNDTIVGNGNTHVAYTTALAGVTVNLFAGTGQSTAGGDAAGVGVDSFAGVVGPDSINAVSGVSGSFHADILTAAGGRGNFQFTGNEGNDTLTGSTEAINNFDSNEARYDVPSSTNAISVNLGSTSTVNDIGGTSVGTDTLINIERIRGTSFNDVFVANVGFLTAFGTLNRFAGMGGNDTITGNGSTSVEYFSALAAVTVNLAMGTAFTTGGGDAAGIGTDTFTGGVNQAVGSAFGDLLTGSNGAQAERFIGLAGNDTIDGGGGLLDQANYRSALAGIVANLGAGGANISDGFGGTDTVTNVEGVVGSEFADSITGDGNANRLTGQNGDDLLFGMGGDDFLVGDDGVELYGGAFGTSTAFDSGNDTLTGGLGNDSILGGNGNDIIFATHDDGNDTMSGGNGFDILDFSAVNGVVQINQLAGTITGSAGNDTLSDVIEQIKGTNFNDVLSGGHGINVLDGEGGHDQFFGNNGDDLMRGGEGDDTFFFSTSDGNDTLLGGSGFDVLDYSSLLGVVQVNQLAGTTTGTANNDVLSDVFEQVIGTSFGDVLSGGHGINSLKGNGGDDQLFANNGDDYTSGGDGNDTITMGVGNDTHDFRNGEDVDTILDFTAGGTEDTITLTFYSGLGSTSFDAAFQARLSTVSGHAELLLNGGDRIIFNNVASHTSLTAADFIF